MGKIEHKRVGRRVEVRRWKNPNPDSFGTFKQDRVTFIDNDIDKTFAFPKYSPLLAQYCTLYAWQLVGGGEKLITYPRPRDIYSNIEEHSYCTYIYLCFESNFRNSIILQTEYLFRERWSIFRVLQARFPQSILKRFCLGKKYGEVCNIVPQNSLQQIKTGTPNAGEIFNSNIGDDSNKFMQIYREYCEIRKHFRKIVVDDKF